MNRVLQPVGFLITCHLTTLVSLVGTSGDSDNFFMNTNKLLSNKSLLNERVLSKNESQLEPFIFMCIVYTISTLASIITNLIVILVYAFGHTAKTELSIFLINLAIADFLMSTFCMPFTFAQVLLNQWIFGEVMCPIVLFKQVLSVALSIYTMVAIGIDRYYAIKCPLKNRVTHKKSKLTIMLVWLIAVSLASVQLFVARVIPSVPDASASQISNHNLINSNFFNSTMSELSKNSPLFSNYSFVQMASEASTRLVMPVAGQITYTCNENWKEEYRKIYTIFNFFAIYLIPVAILGYTYTRIACILKRSTPPGNSDASRDQNYNKSKNKVIKMLIVLVCAFTLCWLPLHMFTLIGDFTQWFEFLQPKTITLCYYVSHWLAMANCSINPFIYGYSNKKFRSDVYSLLMCRGRQASNRSKNLSEPNKVAIHYLNNRLTKSTSKANFESTQTEALLTAADAKKYYHIQNSQRV